MGANAGAAGPSWTPALSVGDPAVDAQHRELFRLSELVIACAEQGDGCVAEAIELLHEYAAAHFAHEEDLMRERAYPGLLRHKAEHDRFVEDLLELADAHDRGGREAGGAVRLSAWLTEWMIRHIAVTDTEMGRYLAACERPVG
jgi:hemerythrin